MKMVTGKATPTVFRPSPLTPPLIYSPVGSYSWIPGSAGCYKCFNGVPECVAGKEGTTDCSDSDTTRDPTPGEQTWGARCVLRSAWDWIIRWVQAGVMSGSLSFSKRLLASQALGAD